VKIASRSRSSLRSQLAFTGFRFPGEMIVLAVRWYLRYGLSYRDIEELLAERGVEVDHVTIYRWVQRFTPLLADAARFDADLDVDAVRAAGDRTNGLRTGGAGRLSQDALRVTVRDGDPRDVVDLVFRAYCRPEGGARAGQTGRTCTSGTRHSPGDRGFVDETYVKVNGVWRGSYRRQVAEARSLRSARRV
jgi:hypothetical protein